MNRILASLCALFVFLNFSGQAALEQPLLSLPIGQAHHHPQEEEHPEKGDFLPRHHPLRPLLRGIFNKRGMFQSRHHYKAAGFNIVRGHNDLMVGFHPDAPGYLFKKFTDDHSQRSQLRNFLKRIKGAKTVRACIKRHGFKRLVVPHKWLYPLSKSLVTWDHRRPYLLIVEDMRICDAKENAQRYREMDIETLTELCTVLHEVGGCDAYPRNQCFTFSGKIAFVDTEHVGRLKGHFVQHIVPALREELRPYAIALWNRLEEEKEGG